MQKHLKKFGFFASKNTKDESDSKIDDKLVKCLYKNEAGLLGKQQKHKTKSHSPHGGDGSPQKQRARQHQTEDEVRKHKHKKLSNESVRKRHKNREVSPHPYASHTEMYYISPEDIKRHRRKSHKSNDAAAKEKESEVKRKHKTTPLDRDPESVHLRNKRKQTADDIVKFITEHNLKGKESNEEAENYQWLTKKEIFNLISNSKCLPQNTSASLLKKFFVFDKQHSLQGKIDFINVANELSKTLNRYKDDNTNAIFIPVQTSEPCPAKKSERGHRNKEVETVGFSRKSSKHHRSRSRDTYQSSSKHVSDATIVIQSPKTTKGKISKELTTTQSERTKTRPKSKSFEIPSDLNRKSDHKIIENKPKIRRSKIKNLLSSDINSERSESEMLPKSRVNPKRHRRCLVRSTFSVVEIPSTHPPTGHLEKKKKSKVFKKYYRYDNQGECEAKPETYCTYSDSSKMYQDMSELSVVESPRRHHKSREKKYVTPELKTETHVSAILISSKCEGPLMKTSHSKDGDTKSKLPVRKSKIPVLSNTTRMVASLKKTLSPRSFIKDKTIDSLSTPKSNKERSIKNVPVTSNNFVNKAEPVKEKVSAPKPLRSQNTNARSNVKAAEERVGIVKEKPSFKPIRESVEPLKGKSGSKSSKGKNTEAVKEKLPNVRTTDKDKTVAGAKEKVSRVKSPDIPPIKLKESSPQRKIVTKPDVTRRSSVDSKFSNISGASSISKQSKRSNFARKKTDLQKVPLETNRTRTLSLSPPPSHRRRSADGSLISSQMGSKSPSRVSTADSMWSKSSRRPNLTSSDTKLQQKQNFIERKKLKGVERSSTKASLSNSTSGDKSVDSSKGTSFFLTKNYKDDAKWTRWQKRKTYSDSVRKMNQKATVPSQVMEVRYLTVSSDSTHDYLKEGNLKFEEHEVIQLEDVKTPLKSAADKPETTTASTEKPKEELQKDFFKDDLPQPCIEILDTEKFNELFELPMDKALNEILHENYNFLKKDFSSHFQEERSLSSDDDLSSLINEESSSLDKKFDEWYDFTIIDEGSISEISCCNISDQVKDELNVESQDHIIDSCSAPGSEESGYSTIKSRAISKSFFERPDIKALMYPSCHTTLDSYCIELQIDTKSSSHCGLDIKAIESKSLQTVIECSQKCVQIKMSEEELLRTVNLDDESEENEGMVEAGEQSTTEIQTEKTEETLNCHKEEIESATTKDHDVEVPANVKISQCDNLKDSTLPGDDSVEIATSIEGNDKIIKETSDKEKIKVKKKRLKKKNFNLSFLSCITCVSEEE